MSISFNHPKNTLTSTGSLNLTVTGGSISTPQPIRFNSTSVVIPVRNLPSGEAGAMVFDSVTKTMKYHNGLSWVEMLGQDVILQPIYNQLNIIDNELKNKVDSVTYQSAAVPSASISGTQLNITFPLGGSSGGSNNGLYTSSKQGSIQMYSLNSGMNATNIREQMSGETNGQNGRDGSSSNPWKTNDGWCYADGMWWTWTGSSGTVTVQVPNLNQQAYLKPMSINGVTQTNNIISMSGSIGATSLSISQLPPISFSVSGQTSVAGEHNHRVQMRSQGRNGTTTVTADADENAPYFMYTDNAGNHIHTFTGTTNTLGSGNSHTHTLDNVDVSHLNVAIIYNIATPSFALNEAAANGKYVLKSGDTMSGALTIASGATIKGDDTNITLSFRSSNNNERAMIYHNSTSNTLRLRSFGGSEVFITTDGTLNATNITTTSSTIVGSTLTVNGNATVQGKNVVRSVNNTNADGNGNVSLSIPTNYVQDIRLGPAIYQDGGGQSPAGYVVTWVDGGETMSYTYAKPIQKLVNGVWSIITG